MQDLAERMKRYEAVPDLYLTRRVPVIGRLDGKAFHTLTRDLAKPYDSTFTAIMQQTAFHLLEEIQGCKFVHTASDEISLLLTDYDTLATEPYFGYRLQKMCSIAAATASVFFSTKFGKTGLFDARFFTIPEHDVTNYFVWRQKDAARNSVSALAQSVFSHKELQSKSNNEMQDMLHDKGINWNNTPVFIKRGACAFRIDGEALLDLESPEFTKDREYVERFVRVPVYA